MRHRLPLIAIVAMILVASCGGRPGFSAAVNDVIVPSSLTSTSDRTGCSGTVSDYVIGDIPEETVSGKPVLTFSGGAGTSAFRGWIYDMKDGRPAGAPIEEFTVPGSSGRYEPQKMSRGKTYEVLVNAPWSFVITSGEETHVFRVRLVP